MKAGWNWLHNSPKWHYFDENGRSLCGRYMTLGSNEDADPRDVESKDNCKACFKKRQAVSHG